ncbi:MAG: HAD family phosphatase [Proteobacteria bacterium]|nr:HAD family phosphatase [Pseudomonadota bacterium]
MDGCPPDGADESAHAALLTPRLPPPGALAPLKAVIFDMDGLMLDTERWERAAWREVAQAHGHRMSDEFFATLIGRREADTAAHMRAHFGARFPFEAARTQARERFDHWMTHCPQPVKPGLSSLLAVLHGQGFTLAVASSTRRARALARLGPLAVRFAVTVFGDEVRHAKPDPEIYLRTLSLLGVDPAEALALEDSPPGFAAARAAGLTTVVIPDILPPPADAPYVCNSLTDIENWILSRAGS